MSQDWLARLRESESGWNEPAFPERSAARQQERIEPETPSFVRAENETFVERRATPSNNWRIAIGLVLTLLAISWITVVLASVVDRGIAIQFNQMVTVSSILSGPLLLLGGLAALLLGRNRSRDRRGSGRRGAPEVSQQAALAAARLNEAHAQLTSNTRDFATVADQSASAILSAMQAMATQTSQLEQNTATSIATLTTLSDRIASMTEALPRLEDRLATLGETLARVGGDLGQKHDALDEQLQATALIAEEARLQLTDAGTLLGTQLSGLRDGARQAGEELAGLSELSSARIDLTLDRVKSVLESTEQRIDEQNKSLVALVERSRLSIEDTSGQSLERFTTHCRKIEEILAALDQRIVGHAEKSNAWLEGTAKGVGALANEMNALEQSAMARTESLSTTMNRLVADTRQLAEAIESGQGGSEQLVKRAEALLVALDSSVRELDESIPGSIGRVEAQIGALQEQIRSANPAIEAVEVVAKGVVSQLHESDQIARAHVTALTEALQKSQGALSAQKQQIEALAQAVNDASDGMAQLGERIGPQMVEALASVREHADTAAARAREAIAGVIPDAAAQLSTASGAAIEKAVTASVSSQLERLSLVADDAVKAAHRATDKLTRQMLSLTDASKTLEGTLAANAQRIEGQDRDLMAQRSAQLIASLNERAIDVNKWLDRDVSEADWTAYLKGDQGLFARRATRLITTSDAKLVHALYNEDTDFREHVNRYIHDFEALLRTVMAARDGSTLALTMVSSDIGKLYVALAQAIERLRSH